jgi:hypothetical protein
MNASIAFGETVKSNATVLAVPDGRFFVSLQLEETGLSSLSVCLPFGEAGVLALVELSGNLQRVTRELEEKLGIRPSGDAGAAGEMRLALAIDEQPRAEPG